MDIDHVVLWVESEKRSLEFYVDVLGMTPLRVREFEQGRVIFPSVRVNENTILDLMNLKKLSAIREFTGDSGESGGTPINHVCFSVNAAHYTSLTARLEEHGVSLAPGPEKPFGALGDARRSVYFRDPDGNILELRHYDEAI